MDIRELMSALVGPTFVWRMANGVCPPHGQEPATKMEKSGVTRRRNAEREIHRVIMAYARGQEDYLQ